jgi:hypothetical protein
MVMLIDMFCDFAGPMWQNSKKSSKNKKAITSLEIKET